MLRHAAGGNHPHRGGQILANRNDVGSSNPGDMMLNTACGQMKHVQSRVRAKHIPADRWATGRCFG